MDFVTGPLSGCHYWLHPGYVASIGVQQRKRKRRGIAVLSFMHDMILPR